ncbi:hypothetical protein B0H11DRAFT_245559 [Mycena galericulata]|nr:hypothetical protein B0H11DRAFT_245559 [Mycena galericulata]
MDLMFTCIVCPFLVPTTIMASGKAEDLRKRIKEISSTITRHREILRDLEKQKSSLQGELNSIRDPMARLPLEISSNIFMQCLSTTNTITLPNPRGPPMVFVQICQSWRNIALSTPSLWTSIRVERPSLKFVNFLEIWLERARNLPLSIVLFDSLDYESIQELVVEQRAGQLRHLEVYLESLEDVGELTKIAPLFVSLETLKVGHAGSEYKVDGTRDDWGSPRGHELCIDLLRATPNLLEYQISDMYSYVHVSYHSWHGIQPLTHSSLRHLYLGGDHPDNRNSSVIIKHLTLPALQTLRISYFDISIADLASLLTRSSASLLSLDIQDDVPDLVGVECCRLVPGITNLKINLESYPADFGFFESLARTDEFLPNLRHLSILRNTECFNRSQLEHVLTILSARRGQLQSFRLVFVREKVEPLDADILFQLRQFVESGMRIHIGHMTYFGHKEQSYV